MTPKNNRAGQALDLEALEKLISPLADFTHHDECGARESYDAGGDEIDDDPLEFLKGCDCGLDRSWAALQMIRAERTRIRELEARTPAPEAVKLVDAYREAVRDFFDAGYTYQIGTAEYLQAEKTEERTRDALLTTLSQPLPVAQPADGATIKQAFSRGYSSGYQDCEENAKSDWEDAWGDVFADLLPLPAVVETREECARCRGEGCEYCSGKGWFYPAYPTLPPNPKGREQGENQA